MCFVMFLFRVHFPHARWAVGNKHVHVLIIRNSILLLVAFSSFAMSIDFVHAIAILRLPLVYHRHQHFISINQYIQHFSPYFFFMYFNLGWFTTYQYIHYICLLHIKITFSSRHALKLCLPVYSILLSCLLAMQCRRDMTVHIHHVHSLS